MFLTRVMGALGLGRRMSTSDTTGFEHRYALVRCFDHPLYQRIFRHLSRLEREHPLRILDVGGRRSNYTIGLNSRITITDVPRETTTQHALDLGITSDAKRWLEANRSNLESYRFDDMTQTSLPPQTYDVVVAIEVLEHVEKDEAFVRNVARTLKPGGTFLMTTPNGDFIPTPYPDHKRHYRRAQLAELLAKHFAHVDVGYCVNHSAMIRFAVFAPKPLNQIVSPFTLGISYLCERLGKGGSGPMGKNHLIAMSRTAA